MNQRKQRLILEYWIKRNKEFLFLNLFLSLIRFKSLLIFFIKSTLHCKTACYPIWGGHMTEPIYIYIYIYTRINFFLLPFQYQIWRFFFLSHQIWRFIHYRSLVLIFFFFLTSSGPTFILVFLNLYGPHTLKKKKKFIIICGKTDKLQTFEHKRLKYPPSLLSKTPTFHSLGCCLGLGFH